MQTETVYADLHVHTTCSDGALSPPDVVDKAVERGLRVLAVTDHDTVAGLSGAQERAADCDLRFLPGVELSITVGDNEIHLLAYDIDPDHAALVDHLESMAEGRKERAERMVERLRAEGIDVYDDTLAEDMASDGAVGRPHVASALVRGGFVDTIRAAFDRYLGRGEVAFVEKPEVPADRILPLVHEAGGVGVLAHPGHWTPSAVIRALVDAGLDGIETVHPSHDPSLRTYYERLARGYGLVETGGSDYHGWTEDDEDHFGSLGMSRVQWERFMEVAS